MSIVNVNFDEKPPRTALRRLAIRVGFAGKRDLDSEAESGLKESSHLRSNGERPGLPTGQPVFHEPLFALGVRGSPLRHHAGRAIIAFAESVVRRSVEDSLGRGAIDSPVLRLRWKRANRPLLPRLVLRHRRHRALHSRSRRQPLRSRCRSHGSIPARRFCGDDFWGSNTVEDSRKSAGGRTRRQLLFSTVEHYATV
jgi:hypothetical protein